jgi:hypothetical protein
LAMVPFTMGAEKDAVVGPTPDQPGAGRTRTMSLDGTGSLHRETSQLPCAL